MDKRIATARANDLNLASVLGGKDPNWMFVAIKGKAAGNNWVVIKYQRTETATATLWQKVGIVA
jgi:hypothetical protein